MQPTRAFCKISSITLQWVTVRSFLQWKRGASKEDRDQNKQTPLSWAAEYGALRVVKILLENRAKVNSMDDMYLTPLSWLIQASTGMSRTATEAYLRKNSATERGAKRAWILRKLRMLYWM
ncbi:unnamed protein product [Penicillium nalgiovense]|uniref:Uncharacterized protein n=1 Tax=Penicillium nalgiovense TaxID=60175 RepID=A0A9W4MR14_PENNA|nr:unnamed protein product [Penicillium nalgiovense]CAG8020692.1 unnamed protein product [Penicillium nalgiovense]CAG8024189.1 unnamed protein product [Penicillium nalgiovense]CAG8026566.1 unnamed protein product [Penicillium nalgiovense]CAG8039600.1 unnamed protein product [Penicillium nalgiovense]